MVYAPHEHAHERLVGAKKLPFRDDEFFGTDFRCWFLKLDLL